MTRPAHRPRSSQSCFRQGLVVRAAALEAIAKRGDPALLESAAQEMSDKKDIVRFSAAATVLHLTCIAEKEKTTVADEQ